MTFTIFSFAILLICVLCIGKEAFKGFKGGFFLSLISLAAVISGVILAILIARPLSREIASEVMAMFRYELFGYISVFDGAYTLEYVLLFFMQAVISSVVFVILFLVYKLVIDLLLKFILKQKLKNIGGDLSDSDTK